MMADPDMNFMQTQLEQLRDEQMRALNDMARKGTGSEEEMMKLLDTQKYQLQQESERLRGFMKDFMDKMIDMQQSGASSKNQSHKGGFDMPDTNQLHMQQIGNVFYNLLNMVGTQNKDERMIGLSKDLRHMI